MHHSESTFVGSGGLSLFRQTWQDTASSRAGMALVHGFGEHSGRYRNIVDYLVPIGIDIYSYDHRGHGRSAGRRGHVRNWSEFRDDLGRFLNLVRKENGDRPLFVMGHSMGGLILLNYLLHEPETEVRAVIASSPLLAQPSIAPVLVLLSRVMSLAWPGFSINTGLDAATISRDPGEVQAYLDDPLVHSTASARFGTELSAAIEWTQRQAPAFKFPVMIVHGDADRLVPASGSRQFFDHIGSEDKEFHLYAGGFHESHNDIEKETVLKDIENWLFKHLMDIK